jgi:hypothetical protein
LHGFDLVEVEIDHRLQGHGGGAVAQALGQRLEPRDALGLDRAQFGQGVVPALPSAAPRRPGLLDGRRRLKRRLPGAPAGLALGVGQRGVPSGSRPLGITVLRYRGREPGCPGPPAQIRTGSFPAYGSYLGCLTAKRSRGHG